MREYRHEYEMGIWWKDIIDSTTGIEKADAEMEATFDSEFRRVRISDAAFLWYKAGRQGKSPADARKWVQQELINQSFIL